MAQQNSAQNPCERPTSRGRLGSHCSRAGVPERCRASGQRGQPTELFGRRTCAGASSLLSRTVGELAPRDGQTEKVPFSGSRFRLRSASLVPRKRKGSGAFNFRLMGRDPIVVIAITRKLNGQIPASAVERVNQECLCWQFSARMSGTTWTSSQQPEAFLVFLATSV